MMPSAAVVRTVSISAELSFRACCTAYSSVTSRNTSTAPITCPARSRIGAQLSAMSRSLPSRAISTVWLARPCTVPCASVSATGIVAGCRVSLLMIWKTTATGRPGRLRRSPARQPFGDGIQAGHAGTGVGRHHRIADGGERHLEPFLAFRQRDVDLLQRGIRRFLDVERLLGLEMRRPCQSLPRALMDPPRRRRGRQAAPAAWP